MKYKAIIFDMDGTIIDSEPIWQQSIQELLARRGIQLNKKEQQAFQAKVAGLSLEQTCQLLKEITNLNEDLLQIIKEKYKISMELFNQKKIKFMHGFIPFYKRVQAYKLKTALATNAEQVILRKIDNALNLQQLFGKHMYSLSDVHNCAKPDPALYIHASKQLNINTNDCIAIEDSSHGIRAAKQAGIFCIGFNSSKNRALLREADYIVNSYDEIHLETLLHPPK